MNNASLYRPCVGVCLINKDGLIFVGERGDYPNAWQMPQGGIDSGETIEAAAHRELFEETGVKNARIIAIMPDKIRYDLPADLQKKLWGGQFLGQEQNWVAMQFTGNDDEINLNAHDQVEFLRWQWVAIDSLPELIVPFKRAVYEQITAAFKPLTIKG